MESAVTLTQLDEPKLYRPRRPERSPFYAVLYHYFDRFTREYEHRFERTFGPLRGIVPKPVERMREWRHSGFHAYAGTLPREPSPITEKSGNPPTTGTTTTWSGSPASPCTFPTGERISSITTAPTRTPTVESRDGARPSLRSRRRSSRPILAPRQCLA